MAVLRDYPYGKFNFRVVIGSADADGPRAVFCEVSGLSADIGVIEHREGGSRENAARKLPGLVKYGDVTLKRGVIGSTDLWQWFDATRNGSVDRRDVVIQLLNEDRSAVVMAWRLRNCFPTKYVGPTLCAEGNDIAIEELVLAVERIDVE